MVEENVTNNTNFSPYMRELQTFIARINNDFLSKFNCKKLVAESCLPIANHSIDRFVLQASLIRPVSNPAGSKKLLQGKIIIFVYFNLNDTACWWFFNLAHHGQMDLNKK